MSSSEREVQLEQPADAFGRTLVGSPIKQNLAELAAGQVRYPMRGSQELNDGYCQVWGAHQRSRQRITQTRSVQDQSTCTSSSFSLNYGRSGRRIAQYRQLFDRSASIALWLNLFDLHGGPKNAVSARLVS